MKQDLHLPADYAVLSDNEMTYTQGGGVISTLLGLYSTGATIVGTGVLAASYAWGIPADPSDWLKQPGQQRGQHLYRLRPCPGRPVCRYEEVLQQLPARRRVGRHGVRTGSREPGADSAQVSALASRRCSAQQVH